MRVLVFSLIYGVFSLQTGHASQTSLGHQDGQRFAQGVDRSFTNDMSQIPGYKGTSVAETRFRSSELSSQSEMALRDRKSAAGFLLHSESNRAQFDINPHTDPLLKESHGVVSDPEEFLKLESEEVEDQPTDYVEIKCIKPLEFSFTIDRMYTPEVTNREERFLKTYTTDLWNRGLGVTFSYADCRHLGKAIHKTATSSLSLSGRNIILSQGRNTKADFDVSRLTAQDITSVLSIDHIGWRGDHIGARFTVQAYLTETIQEVTDNWTTYYGGFEDYLDHGDYSLIDETVVEGATTKNIKGMSVTSDVWHIQQTYVSKGTGPDTCQALLERGCEQVGSVCIEEINGQCVKVENTYRCPDRVKRLRRSRLSGENVFCLDGNCTDVAWQDNPDMMEALSKLALFQEMQNNMKDGHVFKGNKMSCSKHCWGFSNCCQVSGGWGESIGLTRCSETEKELAQLRGENKCRYVGTYCAEKINLGFTKVCIMKKSSYCCFGNKLTRLIQEQGRAQLGMGWGSAKVPCCRGLTAEELTAIDFDQLDLQEAFDDIRDSFEIPNPKGVVNRFEKNWKNRLPSVQDAKDPREAMIGPIDEETSL